MQFGVEPNILVMVYNGVIRLGFTVFALTVPVGQSIGWLSTGRICGSLTSKELATTTQHPTTEK